MPTVEVLPSKPGVSAGAGWAYTTLPPANAVSVPASTGGRGARNRHSNFENTAARQRQINSRISDLEKDNYRDVHIPLPKKESGARASARSKTTSTQNVRRILLSQKTFVNHLADEEALNPTFRSRRASTAEEGDEMDLDNTTPADECALEDGESGGPPLGYARAVSRPSRRPSRTFCEICGYWGTYRCGKCGARYCGLECGGVHQETRCQKFF
ncbi:hypothetical protein FN846DRAFT_170616 [Sphaerosporella brunnea]|uniref:HIT-type domain-containing protein n=1 Tax=Sphaerosporella brunnea TaxID=1250544 RepID=A0A5J5EPC1_9PEZI|nr:hypothetical protein FN846DRAFT_170616 [Sphaerosporella brunnea]